MFIFTIETVVSFLMFVVLFVFYACIHLKTWRLQSKCKHDSGIGETSACYAICRKCGKNLGFIGTEENKIRRKQ